MVAIAIKRQTQSGGSTVCEKPYMSSNREASMIVILIDHFLRLCTYISDTVALIALLNIAQTTYFLRLSVL